MQSQLRSPLPLQNGSNTHSFPHFFSGIFLRGFYRFDTTGTHMSFDEEEEKDLEDGEGALPDVLDDAFEEDVPIPEDDLGVIDAVAPEEEDDLDDVFYGDERDQNY